MAFCLHLWRRHRWAGFRSRHNFAKRRKKRCHAREDVELHDPDAHLFEERILLIKAKDRREALCKAEREARDYARKGTCVNPYGQTITTQYLGFCEVYEIGRSLADKNEIFVTTRLISRKIPSAKIARIYMGKRRSPYEKNKRKKFINREYSPEEKT